MTIFYEYGALSPSGSPAVICCLDIVPGKQRFDITASDLIDQSDLIYFLIYFRQKHIGSIDLVTVMNINASLV